MQNNYQTDRLVLDEISLNDAAFMLELVNSAEWIKFIGDRNIRSIADANEYITKIMNNAHAHFWVVRIKENQLPIGIITFIKRDYLDDDDIGFAFLAKYTKKGYAYEASMAVLNDAMGNGNHKNIFAITVKTNASSIGLLEKLGLRLYKEIKNEKEVLLVYSIGADKHSTHDSH